MNYVEQLMEERGTLSAAIESTIKAAQDNGGLSDEDKGSIEKRQARISKIDDELAIIAKEQDSTAKANEFAAKFLRSPKPQAEQRAAEQRGQESTGSAFIKSAEFKDYDFHGRSARFEFNDRPTEGEFRAPLMTTDLPNTYKAAVVSIAQPTFTTPLFGLVNNEQIGSGSFEYVNYVLENNAAVVPEGGVKPESTLTETIVPGTLDTIAHWTQVTRQALEDSARIRSIIDGKLTEGVNKKVHDSIVAAIQAATLPTVDGAGSLLRALRVAIGTVQSAGFAPNAVLLNPMDWAQLDINVMFETVDGPKQQQSFWGLTPVSSPDQPEGTATVGAFKDAATLFYRSGVGVYATDSHADTFTSNIFTILAERRTKAAVVNPNALCEATTGTTAPAATASGRSSK